MNTNTKTPVLDHGYISLIESWGSDERIIESARMSTNKEFLGWKGDKYLTCLDCTTKRPQSTISGECIWCFNCQSENVEFQELDSGDEKLLSYLYSHRHLTPFEMCGLTLEIQAPIFVFREWHRHRTQSYNEMSARYTPLPNLNYVPSIDRLLISGGSNKQATSIGTVLDKEGAYTFQRRLQQSYIESENLYQLSLKNGVPKELARLVLPVARYSKMRASANLRNWLTFLTLRMDTNAQWEIRQYANAVGKIISNLFPRTWDLFIKGEKR